MIKQRINKGFTIVELLIVVVIIAILAAITIVAYNGMASRARDARIKDAASKVVQAIQLWSVNRSNQLPTGSGWGTSAPVNNGVCTGSTGGFAGTGSYACSLEDMLVDSKLLPANFISSLPPNQIYPGWANNGNTVMMFYDCGGGKFYLFYYLENPSATDTSDESSADAACYSNLGTNYGMRGARALSF